MKICAAVFADFERTFLGGRAQLTTPLGTRTVLEHTLARLARVEGLHKCAVVVSERDVPAATAAVDGCGLRERIEVLALNARPNPRRELLSAGRIWNIHAWRGSPLGTTWFDEFVDPPLVAHVAEHNGCDAVLCLDAHQPTLDPQLATQMVQQHVERESEASYTFSQAPPGTAGVILTRAKLQELIEQNLPLGISLTYRPEIPQSDPLNRPPCFQVANALSQTAARLTGDTRRSRELITAAFDALGEDADAVALCEWLGGHEQGVAGPLPLEIELELTTDDPLPDTVVRPRGTRVPPRQLTDVDRIARLAGELAEYDDRLVVLGGHGDPLLHPRFAEVCRVIRDAGVLGLAVRTSLVELTDAQFESLFSVPVDLVQVRIDAHSREGYMRLHGRDAYDQVTANVNRLLRARTEQSKPRPLVACSLTRCAATLAEMEGFYDHWIPAGGWALIEGYSVHGGALPPDDLMETTPPVREACRRLDRRLVLLADGTVPACDQDVTGDRPVGNWHTQDLKSIWTGAALGDLRAAQRRLDLADYPRCAACHEWFRP